MADPTLRDHIALERWLILQLREVRQRIRAAGGQPTPLNAAAIDGPAVTPREKAEALLALAAEAGKPLPAPRRPKTTNSSGPRRSAPKLGDDVP